MTPRMSDEYVWDLERPEMSQEVFERYDVRAAKRLISANPRSTEIIDLNKYRPVFEEYLAGVKLKDDIDWSLIDTSLPVIFTRTPEGKSPIDGRHRLAKALKDNEDHILGVFLTEEETKQVKVI